MGSRDETGLSQSEGKEKGSGAKLAGSGNASMKDMIFRADKIDFKNWDVQLDRHLNRVFSKGAESQTRNEEWEIDLSKLEMRHVVAQGTYGTVYKGIYDGEDVAGNLLMIL